ncbi:MAG: spermidine synthase [Nitrospirota bacterium]
MNRSCLVPGEGTAAVDARSLRILLLLFTLSGITGLIYESLWSHYLKLFLGHAAYAQTLVLAIFMGGMAIGSALCSRYSKKWPNLLAGYALVEGLIGLFALFFHEVFDQAVQFSYAGILPNLGSAVAAELYKWTLSICLILPQTILLGMTFPLMSAGILRFRPDDPGRTISLLYFANSIGAAGGVLISGFLLIRLIGLPGTMAAAGVINTALAACVWIVMRKKAIGAVLPDASRQTSRNASDRSRYHLLLFVSFVTGASSFIYEIGWIRMLSLVLGSSTHAFELMLSAFILGLALGGLAIRRRIDALAAPERTLAFVQVIMGLLALSTMPLYGQAFGVMQWLVTSLARTDQSYLLFNLSGNAIAMAVMLPTTFCAGMTLPLITYGLLKSGHGEKSIGAVYAVNTVGAITGVFIAVHLGLPLLGLKGLITVGAGLDILLGIMLLWGVAGYSQRRVPAFTTAACAILCLAAVLFVDLDKYSMSSGVYRHGNLFTPQNSKLFFYQDGKTATVSVLLDSRGDMLISTNGKVDAAINVNQGPVTGRNADEDTMILAGVLPMAFRPAAETAAVIGFGSGLTTHTLLANPRLHSVDTVEIERSMFEAAKSYGSLVERAYRDPRSNVYFDDAKSFFSVNNKSYDIIISEPSNPWVSGVAGLFSGEFYRLVARHLNNDGVFVQWVQLYEIDINLVASVFKALSPVFSDYAAYGTDDSNMVIVAKKNGSLGNLHPDVLRIPDLAALLSRIQIRSIQDIDVRTIGSREILDGLMQSLPVRPNSDYHPVLDQNAARTQFLMSHARGLHGISREVLPTYEMLLGSGPEAGRTDVVPNQYFSKSQFAYQAAVLRDYFLTGTFRTSYGDIPPEVKLQALRLRAMYADRKYSLGTRDRQVSLFNVFMRMTANLTQGEMTAVWRALDSAPNARSLTAQEKEWVALFKAVSRRDAEEIVRTATAVLRSGSDTPQTVMKYCVASGMIGHLMQRDSEGARKLWERYRTVMFAADQPDLLFRMLEERSTRYESMVKRATE